MRRSTVLSLSLQLVFPGNLHQCRGNNAFKFGRRFLKIQKDFIKSVQLYFLPVEVLFERRKVAGREHCVRRRRISVSGDETGFPEKSVRRKI